MTPSAHTRRPLGRALLVRGCAVLLASVLLTIASAWALQWHHFRAAAVNERWIPDFSGLYLLGAHTYDHLGNGVFRARKVGTDPPPGLEAHERYVLSTMPWLIYERGSRSYVRRSEWDQSNTSWANIYPHLPSSHYGRNALLYIQLGPASERWTIDRLLTPRRALERREHDARWERPERYLTWRSGWITASSFRVHSDESHHALDWPVERWSAQRAG
ncbi:MAG: hypothetical protein AAFX79_03940 [Planctomycetota bacterium]